MKDAGLIESSAPALSQLAGGVSSEILLVEEGRRRFVVKRSLERLRVRDDWRADVARNCVEQDWIDYAGRLMPDLVPRLLHTDRVGCWFAMEYLGAEWRNWKSELMAGRADPTVAHYAGEKLGRLHAASWGEAVAREKFGTVRNFRNLRLEPYFFATAERVRGVALQLRAEAARLEKTETALVHGDYSPKNLLFGSNRLIVLDAEGAWFGDPVFDPAFLLCHLYLKALFHAPTYDPFLALADVMWSAYAIAIGKRADADFQARCVRLVLCLLLARVHGKSPVEYLSKSHRDLITAFVQDHLPNPPATLIALATQWRAQVADLDSL